MKSSLETTSAKARTERLPLDRVIRREQCLECMQNNRRLSALHLSQGSLDKVVVVQFRLECIIY